MRPWQVHARRRRRGPRRQGRVLGPQAERPVRPDPVDYPHEMLPIAPSPTLTSGWGNYAAVRRSRPYLGASCAAVAFGPGLGPASPGTVGSSFGAILRNCLFMDLSRKTRATPMAATTRNPSTPGVTSSLGGEDAATTASTPNVKGTPSPGRPRTGRPRAIRYPRQT